MKKEYLFQLILLGLYYASLLFHIHGNHFEFTKHPLAFIGLVTYHATLFYLVNYVWIPKLFYAKKFVLFSIAVLISVLLYGIFEEAVIEKLLFRRTRGSDPLSTTGVYGFLGEISIPLLTFIIIKILFDNFRHRQQIAQIEKDNLENELKFLRSQIQPHILFNSLNSLFEFSRSKSDKAPDMVLKLSNVLRYVLYKSDKTLIPLSQELRFIDEYVALQKMQLEERGKVNFMVKEDTKGNFKIAPFILIPFIENSFKHSLSTKINDIDIDIKIYITKNRLRLSVENSFDHSTKANADLTASGIGLENVKKRLLLLYPEKHQLKIDRMINRFIIDLLIELDYE